MLWRHLSNTVFSTQLSNIRQIFNFHTAIRCMSNILSPTEFSHCCQAYYAIHCVSCLYPTYVKYWFFIDFSNTFFKLPSDIYVSNTVISYYYLTCQTLYFLLSDVCQMLYFYTAIGHVKYLYFHTAVCHVSTAFHTANKSMSKQTETVCR